MQNIFILYVHLCFFLIFSIFPITKKGKKIRRIHIREKKASHSLNIVDEEENVQRKKNKNENLLYVVQSMYSMLFMYCEGDGWLKEGGDGGFPTIHRPSSPQPTHFGKSFSFLVCVFKKMEKYDEKFTQFMNK